MATKAFSAADFYERLSKELISVDQSLEDIKAVKAMP